MNDQFWYQSFTYIKDQSWQITKLYLSQRTSLRKTDQDQEDGFLPSEATSHLQTKMKVSFRDVRMKDPKDIQF